MLEIKWSERADSNRRPLVRETQKHQAPVVALPRDRLVDDGVVAGQRELDLELMARRNGAIVKAAHPLGRPALIGGVDIDLVFARNLHGQLGVQIEVRRRPIALAHAIKRGVMVEPAQPRRDRPISRISARPTGAALARVWPGNRLIIHANRFVPSISTHSMLLPSTERITLGVGK